MQKLKGHFGGALKSSKYLELKKLVKTQDPLHRKRLIKISGLYPRKAIYLLGKTDILTYRQLISASLPPTVSEIAKMIDFWDWIPHKWDLPGPTDQRDSQMEKRTTVLVELIFGPSWF